MPINGTVNLVAATACAIGWMVFPVVMILSRRPDSTTGGGARRDRGSIIGIVLQSIAIAIVWIGRVRFSPELTPQVWLEGAAPALLGLASGGLFAWSAIVMGANWSLVARTRQDHKLVESGPFALVRNPIYLALFGIMTAWAIAIGHAVLLLAAIPVFLLGTVIRIRIEEKLLRAAFGEAYDAYVRRVKRLLPFVW